MGDRSETSEKKKSVISLGRKISIRLDVKKSVAQRIDEMAYRAGMQRHELVERAIDYALAHKLDVRKFAQDEKIHVFLSAPKEEITANIQARIYPDVYIALQKAIERYGVTQEEYVNLAVVYYIIRVLKLTSQVSQLEQT